MPHKNPQQKKGVLSSFIGALRRARKWIRLRFSPKWVREYEKMRYK